MTPIDLRAIEGRNEAAKLNVLPKDRFTFRPTIEEDVPALLQAVRERDEEIVRLRAALLEMPRVDRVTEWIRNRREPAQTAFTAGPERNLCREIEEHWVRREAREALEGRG